MDPLTVRDQYRSPLLTRYASADMSALFSERATVRLWRRIWLALAESQRDLGVGVDDAQIAALRASLEPIDFARADELERELRHDVMAHIHAWGEAAPDALPILHLGATSADVTDNANLLQLRDALDLLRRRLLDVLRPLAELARQHAALPTLGYTHFQAAQPTTVGKRACLWLQDLLLDLADVERRMDGLRLRGLKGATGTQASFLALVGGDPARVEELERIFCSRLGFDAVYPVTGQTYPRKVDALVLSALSGLGQSCAKFAHDLRLLQHLHEIEEPFETRQVGSSAMPYKRNPMRAERMSALARYLMVNAENAGWTAAGQWLERTLDDSANRRLALPEAFLTADALLILYGNVVRGLEVRTDVIASRLRRELPFLASEALLAAGVRRGGSRQELHEAIRRHAIDAREAGGPDGAEAGERFLSALSRDPIFPLDPFELDVLLAPESFVGLAAEQVERFLAEEVDPVLAARSELSAPASEVRV
ncbi:MAG: adenylosuccinate lyase [Gemmatimonadota bacterium]